MREKDRVNRVIVRDGNLSFEARQVLEASGTFGMGEHILDELKIETVEFARPGERKKRHRVAKEKVNTATVAIR